MEKVYRPERNRQLEGRNAIKPMLTCRICGYTGQDVSERPYYDAVFNRDTTRPICDDMDSCLNRNLPSWYRRLNVTHNF